MSGPQSSDKREAPRRSYTRSVGVLFKGEYRLMKAVDLSETGMGFQTSLKMAPKSWIAISLIMPDGSGMVARAEVVSVRLTDGGEWYHGVKFLGIGVPQRRLIRSFIIAKTEEETEREIVAAKAAVSGLQSSPSGASSRKPRLVS